MPRSRRREMITHYLLAHEIPGSARLARQTRHRHCLCVSTTDHCHCGWPCMVLRVRQGARATLGWFGCSVGWGAYLKVRYLLVGDGGSINTVWNRNLGAARRWRSLPPPPRHPCLAASSRGTVLPTVVRGSRQTCKVGRP